MACRRGCSFIGRHPGPFISNKPRIHRDQKRLQTWLPVKIRGRRCLLHNLRLRILRYPHNPQFRKLQRRRTPHQELQRQLRHQAFRISEMVFLNSNLANDESPRPTRPRPPKHRLSHHLPTRPPYNFRSPSDASSPRKTTSSSCPRQPSP